MIDKDALVGGITGTAVSIAGCMDMQTTYYWVNLILGIIGAVITLVTAVIIPLWKWWKKSKEDNNISAEELDELQRLIKEGGITLEEAIKKIQEKN